MKLPKEEIMNKKDAIFQASCFEFAEHGLAGARVDRIARAAGVNKAMVYYYFRSKEALYTNIVNWFFQMLAEAMGQKIQQCADPEELLTAIAQTYGALFSDHPFVPRLLLHDLAEGGTRIGEALTRWIASSGLKSKLVSRIQAMVKTGQMREMDPRQFVISFIGMNLMVPLLEKVVAPLWGLSNDAKFRQSRAESIVDLTLHGVIPRN
ncbi:putative Transcriptional regulator, TetR family [Candidatus Zixiibacteriota bacterium]|nr:putative Transcriptional regulator, TetR family [candidate division Zixibacteria bacterium]